MRKVEVRLTHGILKLLHGRRAEVQVKGRLVLITLRRESKFDADWLFKEIEEIWEKAERQLGERRTGP